MPARLRLTRWYLSVSSYRGFVPHAQHWYGTMRSEHGTKVDVQFRLTKAQAKALSTDDFTFSPGTMSNRYTTRAGLLRAARRVFRSEAGPLAVLLLGSWAVADPQQPIAGPKTVVAELRRIWRAAERSGGWDVNKAAMQKAANEWDRYWA